MRIALFSECYTPITNGVVTSVLTLRAALRSAGHTVYVFSPGASHRDDDSDVFRLPELPFPKHPYHFARPFPRLSFDFATLNVDVVHCQHPFTVGRLGADLARKHDIPMVYTAHSLYDAMVNYARSSLVRSVGQKAVRGVVRRFCARAACVITPSRHTREALMADGVQARFAVAPTGVALPPPSPDARRRIRRRLGVGEETPLLLYVGRLAPEKRLDVLLHAAAQMTREPLPPPFSDFRAVLVGDGQCRTDLLALSGELGLENRALFMGAQPHETMADWYAAADLFALPSPVETQGLVVTEAMAAGLACVVADTGGAQEALLPGVTGRSVPCDADSFTGALTALLTDTSLRRTMGEAGRQHARHYSPEEMARHVLAVYEAVLTRGDGSGAGRPARNGRASAVPYR